MDPETLARRARRQHETSQHTFNAVLLILTHLVTVIVPMLIEMLNPYYSKQPYHTSVLSGYGWIVELLNGHPERIRTELGVHKHVFLALCDELRAMGYSDERDVTLEEKLAIFLYACVTGLTVRHLGERFQRANGTITKYFREMVDAFSFAPFYTKYVKQPTIDDPPSFFFKDDPKMWPFFRNALGAIDGCHIPFYPPASERELYRNRKGFCSQNGLFCCTFSLYFTYSLTGWEGSSSDARVFEDAITSDLVIPSGYYLLADAGFPHCKELLIPYRGKRYHLQEWGRAKLRPIDREELFNLRHAQARNCIERIFGVVKKRFRILLLAPEYKKDKALQNRIPAALIAIHNFIRHHDPDEKKLPGSNAESILPPAGDTSTPLPIPPTTQSAAAARRDVNDRWDMIAQAMWDSYQAILSTRSEQAEHISQYLYNNIEHPYITRLLGNEGGNAEPAEHDNGDDIEYDEEDYIGEDPEATSNNVNEAEG